MLVGLVLAQLHPSSIAARAAAAASARSAGPLNVTPVHALEDARHASDNFAFAPSTGSILPRAARTTVMTSNSTLRREVFGFAPYWNLSLYSEWNLNLISTVAYFGLDVNQDGTFATQGGGWNGWNSANLTALINKAHLAGDRVVLVIKDFNDSSINTIVTTAAMQNLISQTIAAIASKNLDGVNVDFEGSGSPLFPDIPLGITNLMTAMSSQVHARWPQAEVSIDTYAGAASWDGGIFRIGDLAPVVDAMFVMAYDSVFSNMPGQAGPNSPMTHWTFNDTIDVAQYLTKAPASKIILGVPYYGYKWSTVDGSPYSTVVSGGAAETYSDVIGDLTCGHIAMKQAWDSWGQSPWASWWSPKTGDPCGANLGYPRELYYDDPASLGIKYDLVNNNNLRGTGMWALGYDSGYPDLWNELLLKFTPTTPWSSLGGVITAGPDASSWGADRKDVFVRGTDNALWHRWRDTAGWHGWERLGGVLASGPSAVSWGPNRLDVFVRGTDNALWHKWYDTAGWHDWERLGGVLSSGPDAASWGSGRLDVIVRGTDYALWHKWFDSSGWHDWERLGGVLTSDPAAVSWGPNRIDVFARGTDYALWHRWWDTAGWHGWERLGGYIISGPDVSSCAVGHLDAFALGGDSALYRIGFSGTGFGIWQRLGGWWTSDPGAVCETGTTTVDLFERGPDGGTLWTTSMPGS
jgi:spore germination protein YaaH